MQMHFAAAPFLFGNGKWEMGNGEWGMGVLGFLQHLCCSYAPCAVRYAL